MHAPKQLMSIEAFIEEYSIKRTKFYEEVKKKSLRITKVGTRTYIARRDAEDWLNKIREESV